MQFLSFLAVFFLATSSFAQNTFDFPLGESELSWGLPVHQATRSYPLQVKIGSRLQTVTKVRQQEFTQQENDGSMDFYARRLRFMFQADYKENVRFYMDIRNDNVEKNQSGEGEFSIGDAFVFVPELYNHSWLNLKAFRAKVDVSRSQTVSSARLLFLTRAQSSDEAAQFVSHNRRAMNYQLIGDFDQKLYYQLVVGEGPNVEKFHDARGVTASSIIDQNFMTGLRLRLSPFEGWEEEKLVETYFGRGKHFSVGAGIFHVSNIELQANSNSQATETDRTLMAYDALFHYKGLTLMAEAFKFQNVAKDFSASELEYGSSEGAFVQGEYVLTNFHYLAPFARYEVWDRFEQADNFGQSSIVGGLNWYLKGNKIRVGLFYSEDRYDRQIETAGNSKVDKQYMFTTMWNY